MCSFTDAGEAVSSYVRCTAAPCACLATLLRALVRSACPDTAAAITSTACDGPAAGCDLCALASGMTGTHVALRLARGIAAADAGTWEVSVYPRASDGLPTQRVRRWPSGR